MQETADKSVRPPLFLPCHRLSSEFARQRNEIQFKKKSDSYNFRAFLLGSCGCRWSRCFCGCSYCGGYPGTTRAGQTDPTRQRKRPVWVVCRLSAADLQESLDKIHRSRLKLTQTVATRLNLARLTVVRLPRSSLGGGLQERPLYDGLLPRFHCTSAYLQRNTEQTLEPRAKTEHLEDSQLLF